MGGWVQDLDSRCHSKFFSGKSSQNNPKPVLIFWSSMCIMFASYYDLSVLSMWVMGFHKKSLDGVSSIQFFFNFLNFANPLTHYLTSIYLSINDSLLLLLVRTINSLNDFSHWVTLPITVLCCIICGQFYQWYYVSVFQPTSLLSSRASSLVHVS